MNNYVLNLIIQAKNLSQNTLNQVKGQIGDLQKTSEKTGNVMAGMGDNFKKAVSAVAIGAGIMGGAMGVFGGIALSSASNYETMGVALETSFGGNIEMAKAAQKQITEFATKTPYDLNQVMNGFIKLKNMGLDPSEKAMTSYGNTASAMGKDLNSMVEAVADAATGEFERLKEFGIRASSQGDKVSFTFKGITTTVGKNSKEIEDYLIKLGETNFAGGMEKQSQTLSGKLSTLKDTFDQTMASFAVNSGLLEFAKKAVDLANVILLQVEPAFNNFKDVILPDLFGKFETAKKWVSETAGAVQNQLVKDFFDLIKTIKDFLAPEIETLNSVWQNFIEIVKTLWNNLQPLIAIIYILGTQALQAVFYAFEQLRQPVNDFIQALFNLARPIIDILAPAFVFIVGVISTVLIPVFQLVWAIVVEAFKGILEIITGVINIISGILNIFIGLIKGIFTGDFSQAAEGFKQLWKGLEQFLNGIIDFMLAPIRGIIDGIGNIFKGFDLAKIGVDMMNSLADGLWGMVDIAMGPINWLMDQVNAVLGKQSQAEANAYKNSQPVSGKGSVSQYGFAKGGAFQNGNVVAFADGGVVNSPTNFAMSGGRTGLMGEAGPEFIMPAKRMADGGMGVRAEGAGGISVVINNPTFLGRETDISNFVELIADQLKKKFPTLRTN